MIPTVEYILAGRANNFVHQHCRARKERDGAEIESMIFIFGVMIPRQLVASSH
jgi:hypothetical protein